MIKISNLLFCVLLSRLFIVQATAQGLWTWKWGSASSQTINAVGPGIFSALNFPESRYAANYWTDKSGFFWRYGGNDADLWKYDPVINLWAHIKGPLGSSLPIYGTQGVPNINNTPGSGEFGNPSWVDSAGDLWLYGLQGSNDLWRYKIATNEWTWMHGSGGFSSAIYGTQGLGNNTNTPGNVNETNCKWTDKNNNLWLFNDFDGVLWKYSITSNQWTWVKGNAGGPPTYGTIGVFSAFNQPGAFSACPGVGALFNMWQDSIDNLYMIVNRVSANTDPEIWKYSINLNQWACLRIDSSPFGNPQSWTNQCTEVATQFPIGRTEMRANWRDDCSNVWIFGGGGLCNLSLENYNDLWRYNLNTNNWTWVKGTNLPANFGILGQPNINNIPHPSFGQQTWQNSQGFWMTGGQTLTGDPTHHMWLYQPDTVVAHFTDSTNCVTTYFFDDSYTGCNNIKKRIWNFGDPASGLSNIDSLNINPVHNFSSSGLYTVTLIVQNCTWDIDTFSKVVSINCGIGIQLMGDSICEGDCDTLFATTFSGTPPYAYVWNNGITATNAGPITVCPTTTTTYQVIVTDSVGAKDTANATIFVSQNPSLDLGNDTLCCNDTMTLSANGSLQYLWSDGSTDTFIVISQSGSYWLQANNGGCIASDTIAVTLNNLIFDLGEDAVICEGDSFTIKGPNFMDAYLWNNGSTLQELTISEAGLITLEVAQNACYYKDSLWLYTTMQPTLNLGSDTNLCTNGKIVLGAQNTNCNYAWSTGEVTPLITISSIGQYYVTVTPQAPCMPISDTINIVECSCTLSIPNAFSPNADATNDIFKPSISCNSPFLVYVFQIYNRYGEKIFSTAQAESGWDGTYNNQACEVGTYYYLVKYRSLADKETKILKGDVSLIR